MRTRTNPQPLGLVRPDVLAALQAQFNADREARFRGEAPAILPVVDGNPLAPPALPANAEVLGACMWMGWHRPPGRHAGLFQYALPYPRREELARAALRVIESRVGLRDMSDNGTHEAISLPDADGNGIEFAADRSREARPACEDELSRIGPAQLEEVEGGVRTHDRWERVVDVVARGRQ